MGNTHLHLTLGGEHFSVSEEFLEKYNRPGPRYTSYPTAPVWHDNFSSKDLNLALTEANVRRTPVSLYLHIPFCEDLCLFCACNVAIEKDKRVAHSYLARLQSEINHAALGISSTRMLVQFHIGGGTPTYLDPEQLSELFDHVQQRFTFAPDAEIGIEVDPRVTSQHHLETLRGLGFNRLSMGIQDFDTLVQSTVHRVQSYGMTQELVKGAKDLGFESINLDLIYGLPHQSVTTFTDTLDRVLELAPNRIAMFSYAHVPWLKKQQGAFQKFLPHPIEKFQIFRMGLERLVNSGYDYIGMDHFARPIDELAIARKNRSLHRNFQGYTTKAGADLYGLGVSAISSVGNIYAQNAKVKDNYEARIATSGNATVRGYRLTTEDELRRTVIHHLLCNGVIPKRMVSELAGLSFEEYFAAELADVAECERDGLVVNTPEEICVTLLGRIFVRNVAMIFDPYLKAPRFADRPLFSSTL